MLQDGQLENKITCPFTISAKTSTYKVDLVVDTGSAVSIIPKNVYRKHFSQICLVEPPSSLLTYTKSKVPVLGCLPAKVQHGEVASDAMLYVVKTGTALLGLDLFRTLKLSIGSNNTDPETMLKSTVTLPAAPVDKVVSAVIGKKLGLAKGFVHKMKMKDDIQTVQQKLRQLPVSIREAVSAEIDRLLEMDVIERIDASPWVSPIVAH